MKHNNYISPIRILKELGVTFDRTITTENLLDLKRQALSSTDLLIKYSKEDINSVFNELIEQNTLNYHLIIWNNIPLLQLLENNQYDNNNPIYFKKLEAEEQAKFHNFLSPKLLGVLKPELKKVFSEKRYNDATYLIAKGESFHLSVYLELVPIINFHLSEIIYEFNKKPIVSVSHLEYATNSDFVNFLNTLITDEPIIKNKVLEAIAKFIQTEQNNYSDFCNRIRDNFAEIITERDLKLNLVTDQEVKQIIRQEKIEQAIESSKVFSYVMIGAVIFLIVGLFIAVTYRKDYHQRTVASYQDNYSYSKKKVTNNTIREITYENIDLTVDENKNYNAFIKALKEHTKNQIKGKSDKVDFNSGGELTLFSTFFHKEYRPHKKNWVKVTNRSDYEVCLLVNGPRGCYMTKIIKPNDFVDMNLIGDYVFYFGNNWNNQKMFVANNDIIQGSFSEVDEFTLNMLDEVYSIEQGVTSIDINAKGEVKSFKNPRLSLIPNNNY